MDKLEKAYATTAGVLVVAIVIGTCLVAPMLRKQYTTRVPVSVNQAELATATAFKSLSSQEHLNLAKEALKNGKYLEMDRHLSSIDSTFPGASEVKEAYLVKVNTDIQANAKIREVEQKKKDKIDMAERKAQKAINKRLVPALGMDEQTVYECAWGTPDHINRLQTARGTTEQWCYEGRYKNRYVYFEAGIATAISD